MAEHAKPIASAAPVEVDDERVHIRDLSVDGALLALVRQAEADGRDLELVVRQVLEVGAAVLLHGTAKGTVDAVAAEVDRILTALEGKTAQLEIVRRAREQIASRGLSFETELGAALEACYAPHEDILEATGATKGVADDKVGDYVLTVNSRDSGGRDLRVVIEAKDRPLSLAKALAELDAAALNRGAHAGLMVFARAAQAPLSGKLLRVYPGNRVLVVWEQEKSGDLALEVAAQLARTLALAAEREDGPLNRRGLADRLAKLVNIIDRAKEIERGINGARRGLDSAESAYDAMRDDALALLYELQDRV